MDKSNMDLDNHETMQTIDRDHMLSHINALPDQLEQAWQAAQEHPLPNTHRQPRQIVLCGMGGSAIGGDLAAALVSSSAPAPFVVVRGYDLPAYVTGPDALVILSSHSGNTEETLSAAAQAIERGVQTLAITTGGKLAAHARQHAYLLWLFDYVGQPRAALGWSFGLLVGL
ncbi:MAG: SIS domain-containing protein, partial [Anaerolineae bacterium]|nr:SIS domain-containing protein [Anaerolineae bacterium]